MKAESEIRHGQQFIIYFSHGSFDNIIWLMCAIINIAALAELLDNSFDEVSL
jgi:hypothetical protein